MTTIYKKKHSSKLNSPVVRLGALVLIIGAMVLGVLYQQGQSSEPQADINTAAQVLDENANVTGEWLGIVTEDYNNRIRYEYRLVLEQRGSRVTGTMFIESTNAPSEISAVSSIVGTINGDEISYHETHVSELNNISADHWCFINASLEYENVDGMDTLAGTWHGIETPGVNGCLPTQGRITLMRQ